MRYILCSFCLLFSMMKFYGQSYEKAILQEGEAKFKVDEITIDRASDQLTYYYEDNEVSRSLGDFKKIQYRKGSHWLAGMAGGFAGSIIGSMMFNSGDEEWWYGLAPKVLIGSGLGAGIGALLPKYKTIDISKKTKLDIYPVAVRLKF